MGAFEEVKGKLKQAAGDVADKADLHREGEAQEAKGREERKETQARVEAKAHEAKSEAREQEQRAAQERKES